MQEILEIMADRIGRHLHQSLSKRANERAKA